MQFSRALLVIAASLVLVISTGCSAPAGGKDAGMRYEVVRVSQPVTIDAKWNKPVWQNVKPIELTHYMGDKPEHFPKVEAKVAYDPENVYVIFRVHDRYVRAVATRHQDPVCRDSCAEFFFAPAADSSKGYFNIEMNCGGTMLVNYQVVPRENMVKLTDAELARIEVAHSQPKIVEPEVTQPTVWTIEYRVPVDLLSKYKPDAVKPAPGVEWRANFFKCADKSSHPHWLTWAKVDRPRPDFHRPEYFGTLVFK